MPVTKSHLIEHLSDRRKLPKGKAELVVNVVFDSMVAALQRGDRIEIRGFGSFEVREYKAYEGRNPRTGEPVRVEPKRLPFFKVGKELRERVNGTPGDPERPPLRIVRDDDDDDSDDSDDGDDGASRVRRDDASSHGGVSETRGTDGGAAERGPGGLDDAGGRPPGSAGPFTPSDS